MIKTLPFRSLTPKAMRNLSHFCFFSHAKIYEGMVISEKINYTESDCQQYLALVKHQKFRRKQPKIQQEGCVQQESKKKFFVNRLLLASVFSRLIGSNLPLSIYLSQSLHFHEDLPLQKKVQASVTVIKSLGKDRYFLKTEVSQIRDSGEQILFLSGEAKILYRDQSKPNPEI